MEKISQFENVFVRLIDISIKHFEVANEDIFLDFNKEDTNDEQFDEFYKNKRDLGKIVKELTKLVGPQTVTGVLKQRLEVTVNNAK